MPQPDNATFSIDYYIYENIYNPIAKNICFIHPNIITIIGGLLTMPMYKNLLYDGDINIFIFIGFIKYILDCLDGSIARKCNLKSEIGAFLDIFMDTVSINSLLLLSIYKLYSKRKEYFYNKYLIFIAGLIIIYFLNQVKEEIQTIRNKDSMFISKIDKFIHDNLILIIPLFYYIIKKNNN